MGRSPCCEKAHTNKGAWTKEEDILLSSYIRAHGEGCWRSLPKAAGLQRCGKSCRLRWINYLRPDLKRGNFTEEEDETIIKLHRQLGNKWSLIASHLPGRTDNEIKNYWNTHIKRKVASRGSSVASRGSSELRGTAVNAADRVSSACSSSATQADQPVDILQAAVAVPQSPTSMGNAASTVAVEGLVDLELSIGLPCWDSHTPTLVGRRKEEEEKVVVSSCVSMLISMR